MRAKQLSKNAPLLRTEDARAYAHDICILSKQLASTDIIGHLLLRDLVDCDFEVRRMRTVKAAVIERACTRAAAAVGLGYNNGKKDTLLAAIDDWERRPNKFDIDDEDDAGDNAPEGGDEPDGNDVPPVEEPKKPKQRKKSKQEQQVDMANAFLDSLEAYERLDQLLGRAVAMRKEAVRLFEHHVERARMLQNEVIDAECTDVPMYDKEQTE